MTNLVHRIDRFHPAHSQEEYSRDLGCTLSGRRSVKADRVPARRGNNFLGSVESIPKMDGVRSGHRLSEAVQRALPFWIFPATLYY